MKLFRFRLRTLLLFMALVSVLLAWQMAERERQRNEHQLAIIHVHERLWQLKSIRREQLFKANFRTGLQQLGMLAKVRRTEREIAATEIQFDAMVAQTQ